MHAHVCTCMGRTDMLAVFLNCSLLYFWDSVNHNLELTDFASLAGQRTPGVQSPVSAFPVLGLQVHASVLRPKLRSLNLCGKHFIY